MREEAAAGESGENIGKKPIIRMVQGVRNKCLNGNRRAYEFFEPAAASCIERVAQVKKREARDR